MRTCCRAQSSPSSCTLEEFHRQCAEAANIRYRINRRAHVLSEHQRSINRLRSKCRARGEHAFRVVKHLWGFTKVRFRGLAKNTARAFTTFALANLYLLRKAIDAATGKVRLVSAVRTCNGARARDIVPFSPLLQRHCVLTATSLAHYNSRCTACAELTWGTTDVSVWPDAQYSPAPIGVARAHLITVGGAGCLRCLRGSDGAGAANGICSRIRFAWPPAPQGAGLSTSRFRSCA